jgi:hypothetical protein
MTPQTIKQEAAALAERQTQVQIAMLQIAFTTHGYVMQAASGSPHSGRALAQALGEHRKIARPLQAGWP